MDDRRKHVRFNSMTIVQYKENFLTAKTDTVTKDVSLGGLCFFSEKKLKMGQMIKLRLFYDPKAPARIMKGRVIWSREYKDKGIPGYLNGLSFIR